MNKNRLRGVLSHRLFIILLLLLQIAFFNTRSSVLSGSQDSWLVSLFFSLVSMLVAIHVVSKHEKNTRSSGSPSSPCPSSAARFT